MRPWKVRQVQMPVIYHTADLLGYCILDIFFRHLQIDQLRRDHYDDDGEDANNQQAFDQQVGNFPEFAHDGFSNCNYIAGLGKSENQKTLMDCNARSNVKYYEWLNSVKVTSQ